RARSAPGRRPAAGPRRTRRHRNRPRRAAAPDLARRRAAASPVPPAGPPRPGSMTPRRQRRLRIPAVVQTSAMDCGPAALAALLAGFGIASDPAELRRACRVGLEGSSIDVLEIEARQRGLDAEQVIVPDDHVLLPAAR